MKAKYVQLLKGCIALTITITVLCLGQAMWRNYAINLPLDKVLHNISGVETVTLDNNGNINDAISIYITLGNTTNIQETYKEIKSKIEQTLKNRQYTLEIKDSRSPDLEQVYYDIHYYIQKALVDGDFPMLEEKAREKAGLAGAGVKVYVDEQNVYMQLAKSGSSLYAVVNRNSPKVRGDF